MSALAMTANPDIHLTFGRVTRSEWIKQFSLRSTYWTLGITLVLWVGMTALFLTQSGNMSDSPEFWGQAPTGVYQVALFVLPIVAAMSVTNEYASGMIRATLAAVPRRLPVLVAKALVIAIVTAAVTTAAIAINLGLTLMVGGSAASSAVSAQWLGRDLLTVAGVSALSLIALGFGFLIRSTAGAIGASLGLFLLAPMLFELTERIEWLYALRKFLPTNAVNSMLTDPMDGYLTAWQGGVTLAAWVVVTLWAAAAVLRRRDV